MTVPFVGVRPVPNHISITQWFAQNLTQFNSGSGHSGHDFGCHVGTEVVAIADGEVILIGDSATFEPDDTAEGWARRLYFLRGGGGNVLAIQHAGNVVSTMSHLESFKVRLGQKVKQGQVVARSGATGTAVLGAHLHFEILIQPYNWLNGYYARVDPSPYITEPYRKLTSTSEGAIVSKSYKLETQWTTKLFWPRANYGHDDHPDGIAVHHWGNPGQKFENVCHELVDNVRSASAHYVVEDGRIACLAPPEVATFHSGNTFGNGALIGIEMRPEMTKGDFDTLVQLTYELETVYGDMKVYFHKELFATACPGKYEHKRDELIRRVNHMHQNGGQDPDLVVTKPVAKAVAAVKNVVKPEPKPAPKPGELDTKTVTDINGNVRHLKDVLNWRFGKLYELGERAESKADKANSDIADIRKELAELTKGA